MKLRFSTIAILVVALTCLIIDFSFKNWEKQERVIEHDIHWYYSYLPAKFIYNDIKLEQSDYHFEDDYYLFWPIYTPDGKKVIKTTMGLSIMYAPFFFAAHAYACVSDYPENGFSIPYKLFLLLSAIFYLIVGLDFLRKILRHYEFSELHMGITILLTGLGTNLLCYSSQSAPMSHAYNFCLFAIFIYYTIKWYQQHSMKNTIILGLLLGLISLIRPSNGIIVLFFGLYGVSDWTGFKERLAFFRKECFLLNVIALCALLVWVPQLLYWKTVTDNYFFYSYTDEGFFFDRPKILEGLFSFRKGWLVYTPVMAFSLIGIFVKDPVLKKMRLSILVFFVINIYIIFSWWCWWYGGTFGQRSLIESYALLAVPMAFLVRYVFEKRWLKFAFIAVCAFFTWLNIFQTVQFEKQSLHWEGMTKELYFRQFGKLEKIPDYDKYISYPDADEAKKGNSCEPKPKEPEIKQEDIKGEKVNLLAVNNKYLCAEQDKFVYANRDAANTWETFYLTKLDSNRYAIQANTGLYLCAELNADNKEITCSRKSAGDWETFVMVDAGNGFVAFKAFNNKYLSVDATLLQIFANAEAVGPNERFRLMTSSR